MKDITNPRATRNALRNAGYAEHINMERVAHWHPGKDMVMSNFRDLPVGYGPYTWHRYGSGGSTFAAKVIVEQDPTLVEIEL